MSFNILLSLAADLTVELTLLGVDREATVGRRVGRAILRQSTDFGLLVHRRGQSLRLLIDNLRLRLNNNLRAAHLLVDPQPCNTSQGALFTGTPSQCRTCGCDCDQTCYDCLFHLELLFRCRCVYYTAVGKTCQPLGLLFFCHMLALSPELEPRAGTGPNAVLFGEVILLSTTALYGDHTRVRSWGAFFELNECPAPCVELQGVLELEQGLRTSGHIGHSLRH